MNNASFIKYARTMSLSLYFVEGLVFAIYMLVTRCTTYPVIFWMVISWFGTLLSIMLIETDDRVGAISFSTVADILSLVLALVFTFVTHSTLFLFLTIMIQWLIVILYLEKILCIELAIFQILILSLLVMQFVMDATSYLTTEQLIVSIIGVAIATWITINIVEFIEKQGKKNLEQEKSLDDLLYLVEVKCDEANLAAKSKSDFLANMSHEIRTPLNSVLGMNEMILRESQEKSTLEYARGIERSGNMLLAIINDILDYSKIESGRMEIIKVEYRISEMVSDLSNMVANRMSEKGLGFNVMLDPESKEYLLGDEVRIRQVVTNLLTNAAKYTDVGHVTLKVNTSAIEEDEDGNNVMLSIEVSDTGRGIKEDDRDKIFNDFQRVDEKKNRNIEGTGLGLAITSNFVSLMKGRLEVDSIYGKGSTFKVFIPQKTLKDDVTGKLSNKRISNDKDNAEGIFEAPNAKALVVDDNSMNLTVASLLLGRTKIQTVMADNGKAAIEAVRANEFDIILLDHMMPEMDGIETLEAMNAEGLIDGIPVIALTANAVSGAKEFYMEKGFSDYLSKPIEPDKLEQMLAKWIPSNAQ